MANQYTGSLEHKIRERFQCGARELLERFAAEGITYVEAEKRIGVTHGTIRKWSRRYDIALKSSGPEEMLREQQDRVKAFFAKELNEFNFLSRRWHSVV